MINNAGILRDVTFQKITDQVHTDTATVFPGQSNNTVCLFVVFVRIGS